jgi:hypothetical protein
VLLLALLGVLLSCTPDAGGQSPATPSSPAAGGALPSVLATPGAQAAIPDDALLEPLRALGPCENAPRAGRDDDVAGLVLPDGAVLTQVSPAEPLTNAQGYIPMTPVQIRVYYQQHPDLEVLSVEDEVQESEVLVEAGDRRLFIKSQAVCELGSVFVAVVAPAS